MSSILFLNHNWMNRGTFFRNFHLARVLAGRGWDADVLTVSPVRTVRWRTEVVDGVHVHQTPQFTMRDIHSAAGFCVYDVAARARFVSQRWFDVLFVSDHMPNVSIPALAARRYNAGLVVADWADLFTNGGLHEPWRGSLKAPLYVLSRWAERNMKTRADLCTAISNALAKRLQDEFGIPPERIHYLPMGCPPVPDNHDNPLPAETISDEGPNRSLRLGLASGGGRLTDFEKVRLEQLAEHYITLTRKKLDLLCIGPYRAEDIGNLFKGFGHIDITGWMSPEEVTEYAKKCDFFALFEADTSANRHRNPTRLTTYLSIGRPIVCNCVVEIAERLGTEGCGIVWEGSSYASKELDEMLTSRERRRLMGNRAQHLASTALSWESIGVDFEHFLATHSGHQ